MSTIDFSKAVKSSSEFVQSANPDFTACTSLRRVACSPKRLLRAVKSAYAPATRALWNGPRRTKRRVSGRVGCSFSDCLRARNCSREDCP